MGTNTRTDTPSISARAHSPTLANRRLRITAARSDPSQLPAQQIKHARGSTLHEKLEWRSRAEARSFTRKDPPQATIDTSCPSARQWPMPSALQSDARGDPQRAAKTSIGATKASPRPVPGRTAVGRQAQADAASDRPRPPVLPCAAGIGLAIGAGHCRGAILWPGNATVPFTPLAPARRTDLHRQRQSPTNEQAVRSRAPLQPFFYRFCLFLRWKKREEASRIFS